MTFWEIVRNRRATIAVANAGSEGGGGGGGWGGGGGLEKLQKEFSKYKEEAEEAITKLVEEEEVSRLFIVKLQVAT